MGQAVAGRKEKLDFAHSFFGINFPRFLCKKGEGIYGSDSYAALEVEFGTLQSHPTSCCLEICLSFVCKSVLAWGSEFFPLDAQLFQDCAAQGEVLLGCNTLSRSASTPAGGSGWQR